MDSWKDNIMVIGGLCIVEIIVIEMYMAITSPFLQEAEANSATRIILTLLIPGLAYILPSILLVIFKPGFYWELGAIVNLFFGWTIICHALALSILLFSDDYDGKYVYQNSAKEYPDYSPKLKAFLNDYGEYEHYLSAYIRWYSFETDPNTLKYKTRSTTSTFASHVRTDGLKHMPDDRSKRLFSELTWLYKENRSAFKTIAVSVYNELGKHYDDPTYKFTPGYYYPVPYETIVDQAGNTYKVYKN